MNTYKSSINNKRAAMPPPGFTVGCETFHGSLFDFQKDIDQLGAGAADEGRGV